MRLEVTKEEYFKIKEFLDIHFPEVVIESVIMDETLVKLGFTEKTPCIMEVAITQEQIKKMREICDNYDLWYCMSMEEPPEWWDPMMDNWHPKESEDQKRYDKFRGISYYFEKDHS